MRIRRGSIAVLAIAVLLVACVPDPPGRESPSGLDAEASPSPTPIPTPAGPAPSPSYVRPTPTPQPTFFLYTVRSGDSLDKIAKRYGTSGRSIAYWNRVAYPSLDPDSGVYRPNYLVIGWMLRLIPHSEVDPENLPGEPTPDPSAADTSAGEAAEVAAEQPGGEPVDQPSDVPTDTVA